MNKLELQILPYGKNFALSIIDDTDGATLSTIKPVYDLLSEKKIHCTKTVWPLPATEKTGYTTHHYQGDCLLTDNDYRNYCVELFRKGFGIALHTASGGNNDRKKTLKAFQIFEETFNFLPNVNVMHAKNIDNIYWGKNLVHNKFLKFFISLLDSTNYKGHVQGSKYFWGDVCRRNIKYVRHLETLDLNTLSKFPFTPFHDPKLPYVNYWFPSTFAVGTRFFELLTPENIDKLRKENGCSILHLYLRHYTYEREGNIKILTRFREVIEYLSKLDDGWYVPVDKLLDRILSVRNILIKKEGEVLRIKNKSDDSINNLSLKTSRADNLKIYNTSDQSLLQRDQAGYIKLGLLNAKQGKEFIVKSKNRISINNSAHHQVSLNKLYIEMIKRFMWQLLKNKNHYLFTGGFTQKTKMPSYVKNLMQD